jgi:hypothetical protein
VLKKNYSVIKLIKTPGEYEMPSQQALLLLSVVNEIKLELKHVVRSIDSLTKDKSNFPLISFYQKQKKILEDGLELTLAQLEEELKEGLAK